MTRPSPAGLRIAVIASAHYAVDEPFAGGLEAHTWLLVQGLQRRGHQVTVFAADAGSGLGADRRLPQALDLSETARSDVSLNAEGRLAEHHAYLGYMLDIVADPGAFDLVHNNSIHHVPVAMARAVPVPVVTTLHSPPTAWLESAIQLAECPVTFVAVSAHTATAWQHVVPGAHVVLNGVDLSGWQAGPGGGPLIWFGRLVPEKGPHLAIDAARQAGLPLDLVGPRFDQHYFQTMIEPRLGDGVRYLGHLDHSELAVRVAYASASLVTPCWEEPYGLVAAESLACGTPVAGFARGALPEIVDDASGVLVGSGDVEALAYAALAAVHFDRAAARARAESFCSVERMLDGYENLYRTLTSRSGATVEVG